MNELELRAYGLIAQAIARHAFAKAEAEDKDNRHGHPDAPWPIYYHWATSTFEAVTNDLERLRILKPLNRGAHYFVFDCEVSKANAVAERNALHGPLFFELLVTFIDLFGDFGTEYWGFSTKQDTLFGVDSRIAPALEALASLGYLTKTGGGYVWTDLIAPAMRTSDIGAGDWRDLTADQR